MIHQTRSVDSCPWGLGSLVTGIKFCVSLTPAPSRSLQGPVTVERLTNKSREARMEMESDQPMGQASRARPLGSLPYQEARACLVPTSPHFLHPAIPSASFSGSPSPLGHTAFKRNLKPTPREQGMGGGSCVVENEGQAGAGALLHAMQGSSTHD